MGREVRRVPANWQHPKNERGEHIPLHDGFCKALTEWHRGKAMWGLGLRDDWNGGWKALKPDQTGTWEDWAGEEPKAEDYMPDWAPEARTHIQMYENTSEGTPISPVFAEPEPLARWLADNNASAFGSETATYEQWLATIKRGWAISGVFDSDHGMRSGVAALADMDAE